MKYVLAFFIFLIVIGVYLYSRPLPEVRPTTASINLAAETVSLPWPNYGQAALMETNFGPLDKHGEQKAQPMASTAKLITALAVLKQKPLNVGEGGPKIVMTQTDVDSFNDYFRRDGAVIEVSVGEELSQLQALQALLIASANNMADSLARWAFGSMEEYVRYANQMLAQMGLKNTRVADASGFSKNSVSTAEELTKVGSMVMNHPVLTEIVGTTSIELPLNGKVNNINWLLGTSGVIGIKTGSTDEAGGCFVFAAKHEVLGQSLTLIGAIMGAPTRDQAIRDATTLLLSIDNGFSERVVVKKSEVVGRYSTPWRAEAEIISPQEFKVVVWKNFKPEVKVQANSTRTALSAGADVGQIKASFGQKIFTQDLILKDPLEPPAWHWRLLH